MRTEIVHPGAKNLVYEIRKIVEVARQIEKTGKVITWENIGDPVAKGAVVPDWIREIVQKKAGENNSFGYSPTAGLERTREYIANERNLEGGIQVTKNDIFFFNGLGDAISTIYSALHPNARVIGPNPAYPTHSSAEAAHTGKPHITYRLDPDNKWEPDLVELEEKIVANPDIAGILIINPDNPTGFVYSQETIRKMVAIAKKYNLFVISDEIYSNLAFPGSGMKKLASVIENVPGIAMRGISKEFPWPGARCGWLEFYNRDKDVSFDRFVTSITDMKMLEVCATTLPQAVLPDVMQDPRYYPYLEKRVEEYKRRSDYAVSVLSQIPELIIHPAQGAFYMSVVFKPEVLKETQSLPLSSDISALLIPYIEGVNPDRRFVYYLLGATGICVVSLSSGFNSDRQGFRFTLLEQDEERFKEIINTISDSIRDYLNS